MESRSLVSIMIGQLWIFGILDLFTAYPKLFYETNPIFVLANSIFNDSRVAFLAIIIIKFLLISYFTFIVLKKKFSSETGYFFFVTLITLLSAGQLFAIYRNIRLLFMPDYSEGVPLSLGINREGSIEYYFMMVLLPIILLLLFISFLYYYFNKTKEYYVVQKTNQN